VGPIEIRNVENKDVDGWRPLWMSYQKFYKIEIPETATRKTWARFLDPSEPLQAAVALVRGHPVAFAHWVYHRSTWTIEDHCYLQDLFVADEARGKGLGRALIEYVAEDAKREGAARVYWLTHESNRSAMQLYDRVADRSGFLQYRKRLV